MADSLSTHLATQIVEYLANGTQFPTPPTLHVSVEDTGDTDQSSNLSSAPITTAASDWTVSGTTFENANQLDFGDATADITGIESVTIYDGPDPATDNLLLESDITNGPYDVSSGTSFIIDATDLTFDAVEETL